MVIESFHLHLSDVFHPHHLHQQAWILKGNEPHLFFVSQVCVVLVSQVCVVLVSQVYVAVVVSRQTLLQP